MLFRSNLDNVALVAPAAPVAGFLASRRMSTNLIELEWPELGGFQLEVSASLSPAHWAGLAPLSVSNGLNRLPVDINSGSSFFRLMKP